MKLLLYNWVQFDKKDGGGVTVYLDNVIQKLMQNKNIDIYFLSSGTKYNLLSNKIKIKKTKNKYNNRVHSYTVYNSPTMFAINQFNRVDIYNNDENLDKVIIDFIRENGGFDVIHFNNLEGLTLNTLKIKEKFPNTRFIYTVHNYYPICPMVYLWSHNKENCKNYNKGAKCCNCIKSDYNSAKRLLRIRTLLDRLHINTESNKIRKIYNSLKKKSQGGSIEISNKGSNSNDYQKFREKNVEYLNKYMDDILCVSKRVQDIVCQNGFDNSKCHVSYIGTKFADNLHKPVNKINTDKFNLVYFGYMNTMKGFDFLVKSLLTLDDSIASSINVHLICRNNPEYNINEIIEELSNKYNKVIWKDGYTHNEFEDILKNMQLAVIPVVWEDNLPQVSIEVSSFGIPVLASDLGGASELCSSDYFKYEGGNVKDFQKKLSYIVKNREVLKEYFKHYNKPTTMDKHIKELYEYYGLVNKDE